LIRRVQAKGFRCFSHQRPLDVNLKNFQILIGPNASGKSSFLDIFSFIADVVRDGLYSALYQKRGVRNIDEICWMKQDEPVELAIELTIPDELRERLKKNPKNAHFDTVRYEISVGKNSEGEAAVLNEQLLLKTTTSEKKKSRELFSIMTPKRKGSAKERSWLITTTEKRVNYYSETTTWQYPLPRKREKAGLAGVLEDEERFPVSLWCRKVLTDGLFLLMMNPASMRSPCPLDRPKSLLPDGSNLPLVVNAIQKVFPLPEGEPLARLAQVLYQAEKGIKAESFDNWKEHLKTVLPIDDIMVYERKEDRSLYIALRYTNGLEAPSWLVSDGTLRLLFLTILPYLEPRDVLFLIEEPENGLHPLAIEAVYQSLTSIYDSQALVATHSPVLLSLAKPEELLIFSRGEDGSCSAIQGEEHPLIKGRKPPIELDLLFGSGILG